MTSHVYDTGITTAMNAYGALLNGGTLKIYTGAQPAVDGAITGTLLATLTLNATAFASATASGSGGTMNANAITAGTAVATGTAGYFALISSGAATISTGACGTSGQELNLNTTSITLGDTVSVTSYSVTMGQP